MTAIREREPAYVTDTIMAAMTALTAQRASNEQPNDVSAVDSDTADVTANEVTQDEDDLLPAGDDIESEDAGNEGEPETDDESEPNDPLESEVPVKIDGKTEKLKLKDVIAGYQKDAAVTKKAQALAEERRGFEIERNQVAQERQIYAELLTKLDARLQDRAIQPPPDELYHTNPTAWLQQRELFRVHGEEQQAVKIERDRLSQLEQQDNTANIKEHVTQEREKLLAAKPEWRDNDKFSKAREAIISYGEKIGYSAKELQDATDHRAILVLDKARAYDALMSRKPQENVAATSPTLRPGTPVSNKSAGTRNAQENALQRLKTSNSVDDAMALLAARRKS